MITIVLDFSLEMSVFFKMTLKFKRTPIFKVQLKSVEALLSFKTLNVSLCKALKNSFSPQLFQHLQ